MVGRTDLTKLLTPGEGERLDRFELIADIASGGMATVYLARLSGVAGFQRLVAIKRLHPHLAREKEFVDMFLDEARLAARIHHPNVVPIQEIGQSDRGYYLVMDYIEGDTAARLLARAAQAGTRVPFEVGIRIVLDALAGLNAAHELKDDNGKPLEIVHRDVSPQNILVGVDGTSRLTDFGVARAASRLSTTRSGQLKGKLAYMAPEQARGGAVDRRADIFAMGIVAWEALAFKRLFKGEGEAETLNRVLYEPIPTLRSAVPTIPESLNAVVMKSLERDPDKRYSTAADFADALEKAARTIQKVGSPREVASFLESMVGTDLSQQRDAVRAWLARSEPSRNDNIAEVREAANSITKIESAKGARAPSPSSGQLPPLSSPGSSPSGASSGPGFVPAPPLSNPRAPFQSQGDGSGVSTVSGSSYPVPAPPFSSSSEMPSATPPSTSMSTLSELTPPRASRAGGGAAFAIGALVVVLLAVGGGGVAAYKFYGKRANISFHMDPENPSTPSTGAQAVPTDGRNVAAGNGTGTSDTPAASATAAATTAAATTATTTASSAAPAASDSAVPASSQPTGKSSQAKTDWRKRQPQVTKQPDKTPVSAPASAMPDDISHNPYR